MPSNLPKLNKKINLICSIENRSHPVLKNFVEENKDNIVEIKQSNIPANSSEASRERPEITANKIDEALPTIYMIENPAEVMNFYININSPKTISVHFSDKMGDDYNNEALWLAISYVNSENKDFKQKIIGELIFRATNPTSEGAKIPFKRASGATETFDEASEFLDRTNNFISEFEKAGKGGRINLNDREGQDCWSKKIFTHPEYRIFDLEEAVPTPSTTSTTPIGITTTSTTSTTSTTPIDIATTSTTPIGIVAKRVKFLEDQLKELSTPTGTPFKDQKTPTLKPHNPPTTEPFARYFEENNIIKFKIKSGPEDSGEDPAKSSVVGKFDYNRQLNNKEIKLYRNQKNEYLLGEFNKEKEQEKILTLLKVASEHIKAKFQDANLDDNFFIAVMRVASKNLGVARIEEKKFNTDFESALTKLNPPSYIQQYNLKDGETLRQIAKYFSAKFQELSEREKYFTAKDKANGEFNNTGRRLFRVSTEENITAFQNMSKSDGEQNVTSDSINRVTKSPSTNSKVRALAQLFESNEVVAGK